MNEEKKFDIFISHASEDKEKFIRPLADKLSLNGYNVWYDEFTLNIGDSLFSSISQGIKDSRFGLLVLSKSFFEKQWTKKELEGLISKEVFDKENIILPIWLDINQIDVYKFSPLLTDKFAIQIKNNDINKAYEAIEKKLSSEIATREYIENKIHQIKEFNKNDKKKYFLDLEIRVKSLFQFSKESYEWFTSDNAFGGKDWDDDMFTEMHLRLLKKHKLPDGLNHNNEYHLDSDMKKIIALCRKWIFGKMNLNEAAELEYILDHGIDTDPHFILYNIKTDILKDKHAYYSGLAGIYNIGYKNKISESELEKAQSFAFSEFYGLNDLEQKL